LTWGLRRFRGATSGLTAIYWSAAAGKCNSKAERELSLDPTECWRFETLRQAQ
jgi:hypothetical protein